MNALPSDFIGYFINFPDFNSIKNFLLTSKEYHKITVWSPRYLSAQLSSFYMGTSLPPDNAHLNVENIFKSIASMSFYIERPVTIRGKQLQQLPDSVRQSTKPMTPLQLNLLSLKDVEGSHDSQNVSLLPCVHTVVYQEYPPHEDENNQQAQFLDLLEKMSCVRELILCNVIIPEKNNKQFSSLKPCLSIKEVRLVCSSNLMCNESKAATFLEKFPNVEKITFHEYYHDLRSGPGPIVKDSLVKELCFVRSNIRANNLRYLLTVVPTVEKISFHQHEDTANLLAGFCGSTPVDKMASVKEISIITDELLTQKNLDCYSKELRAHFPNLQKFEMELITKPQEK